MNKNNKGILLVGHGGLPDDCPEELVGKFKRLEMARRKAGGAPTEEEINLDRQIRHWPRTAESDPYQAGLERVGEHLSRLLGATPVKLAYNEFCAPSIEEAAAEMIAGGAGDIIVLTTMFTPGGSHSELEVPEIIEELRRRHPGASIRYAWPYDLDRVAELLLGQIELAAPPGPRAQEAASLK